MNEGITAKNQAILRRAFELVQSVPYSVSTRWVFYRLLQEGLYATKKDYLNKWKGLCSRARKASFEGWRPDTIVDDTREVLVRTGGRRSVQACLDSLPEDLAGAVNFGVDHFFHQDHYVQLWFEARAMAGQFKYYTDDVDLVAFGGDPSIHLKWSVAKYLEECADYYQRPITVLYFGDLDDHGLEIPDSALADIREWCGVDFDLVRCGLTEDQARRFNVPENFEKPGEFQWEALDDEAAAEIITTGMSHHMDVDLARTFERQRNRYEAEWGDRVKETIAALVNGAA